MGAVEALRALVAVSCNDEHRSYTEDIVTFLGSWLSTPLPRSVLSDNCFELCRSLTNLNYEKVLRGRILSFQYVVENSSALEVYVQGLFDIDPSRWISANIPFSGVANVQVLWDQMKPGLQDLINVFRTCFGTLGPLRQFKPGWYF